MAGESTPQTVNSPNYLREIAGGIFLWSLWAAGLAWGIMRSDPSLVFVTSLIIFYVIGLILHELGHAVVAALVGYQVQHIKLGQKVDPEGPNWEFRALGFTWRIYSPLPFAGIVRYFPCQLTKYRARIFAVTAAGPLVNFLATIPFVFASKDHLDQIQFFLLASWTFANGYHVINSLTPRWIRTKTGAVRSDGSNLFRILSMTEEDSVEEAKTAVFSFNWLVDSKRLHFTSAEEYLSLFQVDHKRPWLLLIYLDRLGPLDAERFARMLLDFANHPLAPRSICEHRVDNFLTNHLAVGPPLNPSLWDQLSLKLLELNDCLTTRGTRGSVLIDIGRLGEGKAFLNDIVVKTTSKVDKVYANIFLALAAKAENDIAGARHYAEKAKHLDPDCVALERVVNLLEISSAAIGESPAISSAKS